MFNGDILENDVTSQMLLILTDLTEKVERRVLNDTVLESENQTPEDYKKIERVCHILRVY